MSQGNRTANSMKNIQVGLINKFATMLLNFVSRRIFVDFIGMEYLGINGIFSEVLGVLTLADLGFGTAMAYSFYKPIAENDNEKIAALITFYKKVYNCIAFIVAIIGSALVPFLDLIVKTEQDIPMLEIYYLVFLTNTVVSYLFAYKSSIISASQKEYLVSKYQVWIGIVRTLLQILIIIFTRNYLLYIAVTIVTTIANNLLISKKATELYPIIKEKRELPSEEKKNIFSNLGSIFLYKFASTLLNSTDNTIISVICGTIYVGFYTAYNTVITSVTSIITIVFSSLTASIGNLIVTSDENNRYKVFKCMQMVSFMLATLGVTCMYHLLDDFVVLWMNTDEYLLGDFAVVAIILNFYLATTLQPLWSYREATGLYRKTRYVMVVTAIINIVLSIILGKIYGVGGIILATFISKLVTYVWYEPMLLFNEYFKQSPVEYLKLHLGNLVLVVISLGATSFIMKYIEGNSIIIWIVKAVICTVIVGIICFIGYFKTEEFRMVTNKFTKKR